MTDLEATLEFYRWGFVQVPGILYHYSVELELEPEDLGILGAIFFVYWNKSKPLFRTGVEIGQIMQVCPNLSKNRLSRRLNRLEQRGIIAIESGPGLEFAARNVSLGTLFSRLKDIISRDHPEFKNELPKQGSLFEDYARRIEVLENELEEERNNKIMVEIRPVNPQEFKKISDFISKKIGSPISIRMSSDLRKWMEQYGFRAEFILCMLELCFERKINQPHQISKIARGLKECSINNLEGMENYFKTFVDEPKRPALNTFDPEVAEFGSYTGIDMNAEARKKVYYKWRYDWGFSTDLIKKAGEIMCNKTRTGGLEYIDGILVNWSEKGIKSLSEVEAQIKEYKTRRRSDKNRLNLVKPVTEEDHGEIYIPPSLMDDTKQ
ncbi:MAG: DnaD domain protein [Chitinophagales bacterium]